MTLTNNNHMDIHKFLKESLADEITLNLPSAKVPALALHHMIVNDAKYTRECIERAARKKNDNEVRELLLSVYDHSYVGSILLGRSTEEAVNRANSEFDSCIHRLRGRINDPDEED